MSSFRRSIAGLVGATVLLAGCGSRDSDPVSPEQALRTFQIAEGFRVELFASEPHVVDPVEMAFDENGGIYVAELLDNPDDPPLGESPRSRIKYLEDTDGDGVIDRHTVYADRLLAVEGIAPWKGGLIATAAPDILFLKDTDGDRQADMRQVLYTGFAMAHVERRLSNPRLGLDNWFYVVNNSNPGTVRSPDRPGAPVVNVRNREFRFHPLRGLAEASTGNAQFGHAYNQWGHWFVSQNTAHLQHTVIPPGYLQRNPLLALERAEQDISDHGRPTATVFPISRPQQWRIERTAARRKRYAETSPGRIEQLEGYFTASSGATVYLGDAFPDGFVGSVFVAEGNGNLVHCDLLASEGPTYVASRWPVDADFLASTDNWFRPVNFSNAPDGNLYVLDYYRQFHEHPDFIPEAVKTRLRMNFRAGDTLGRIYRIVPDTSHGGSRQPRLGSATSYELVALLEHANGWHRRTAHRLLLERQDTSVVPALRNLVRASPRSETRLHALWILEGVDSLNPELVETALDDAHPAVRENALRLSEAWLSRFGPHAIALTRDEAPRVAFQAALTVGDLPTSRASIDALSDVIARHSEDRWFQAAVLSAPSSVAGPVLASLAQRSPQFFQTPSAPRKRYVRSVAHLIGGRRKSSEIRSLLGLLTLAEPLRAPAWKTTALEGLASGLSLHQGRRLSTSGRSKGIDPLLSDASDDVRLAAAGVARHFDLAEQILRAKKEASDSRVAGTRRKVAIRILQGAPFADVAGVLETILREPDEPVLQMAAAQSLASFDDPRAAAILLAAWPRYNLRTRDIVAELLIRRRNLAAAFVEAVADGRMQPDDIPAVTRIRLTQHPDEQIRRAASQFFASATRDRDEVVAEHWGALNLSAEAPRGKAVFERECADCHLAKAARGRIGPDLSGVANRSKEDLLTSILDPSYAIDHRYRNYLLETKDGRFYDGILVAETGAIVTLRGETEDVSVLKEDIADLRQSDISLMPEGLEDALTTQELADLITFLRAGL